MEDAENQNEAGAPSAGFRSKPLNQGLLWILANYNLFFPVCAQETCD